MPTVAALFVYPVKGMRDSKPLGERNLTPKGFAGDRRFMVIQSDGTFLTQREIPRLATLRPVIHSHGMEILLPNDSLLCSLYRNTWAIGEKRTVTIWKDTVETIDQGDNIAQELSAVLEREVRLVYLPDDAIRPSRRQADGSAFVETSFSDGYPLLLTSARSLDDLNTRLATPVPMERFRPNIVIGGCGEPFVEETWRVVRIGPVLCYGMKRCGRCQAITIDQGSGERRGIEPLTALARYRKFGKDVCFGMNLNHLELGTIRVGDPVEVLEYGPPFFEN